MVPQKCCAFIQFTTRAAAEAAAERTFEQLVLKVAVTTRLQIISEIAKISVSVHFIYNAHFLSV